MEQLSLGVIGRAPKTVEPYGRITKICDTSEQVRERIRAERPGVVTCADYREVAEDPDVDVVYVCTPNQYHVEQAIACLQSGKHVFLEKPMVVRREEAAPLLEAEEKSGKTLAVDFELRYSLLTGPRVRQVIDSGEIGRLVGVNVEHYRGAWIEEGRGSWRTKPELSGGLFFMEVCHAVDLVRSWLGEVTEVQTFKMENVLPHYRIPDNVDAHLLFENGTVARLSTAHARSARCRDDYPDWEAAGHHDTISIVGTKGSLMLDIWKVTLTVFRLEEYPRGSGGVRVKFVRCEDYSQRESHELHHDSGGYLADFIRRMAGGEGPLQTAQDAWRTHAVCLAAEESALTEGFPRLKVDYSPL